MQKLEVIKTDIKDLVIIKSFVAPDERGFYRKYFEKSFFEKHGIPTEYTEASDIFSKKGVIRGLHYQEVFSQGKLIHVLQGEIYDVVLDLREDSDTFGEWKGFRLNSEDKCAVFVPEGFAHGFMALRDDTLFTYQCTGKYYPEACGGILWNDPQLNISWPIDENSEIIMTKKDREWPTFKEYLKERGR